MSEHSIQRLSLWWEEVTHGCSTGSRQAETDRETWQRQTEETPRACLCTSVRVTATAVLRCKCSLAEWQTDRCTHLFMNRAHLWLSHQTEEVKGGQSRRAGVGRQLVNAVDNQMDEPILQGAAVLLSCLLTDSPTALGHPPAQSLASYLPLWAHVNNSFEHSLMSNLEFLFSHIHNLPARTQLLVHTVKAWKQSKIATLPKMGKQV